MKMNEEKLGAFCEMMAKELSKIDCCARFATTSEYRQTDIIIEHRIRRGVRLNYVVIWNEAHSLTEAAVPILADVKMKLNQNVEQTKNLYYGLSLTIKDVIFNPPATIVLWMDGTKTVVKDQGEVFFDPEKGMAMAIAKKALGNNGNYYNQFTKYIDIWEKKQEDESAPSHVNSVIDEFINKFRINLSKANYNTVAAPKRPKIDTEVIFASENDAIVALYNLRDIFDRYRRITIGDLYDEAEIKCDYTYSRYGWTKASDVHNAKVVKVENGYMIDFPEPTELN